MITYKITYNQKSHSTLQLILIITVCLAYTHIYIFEVEMPLYLWAVVSLKDFRIL